jgi:hypothetical protein
MNKYVVVAWGEKDDYHEVVSKHDTKESADKALLQCQEGDDKHDPWVYTIEKMEEQ